MKIVKYISVICLSLLVFSACDSDLDKVYYNESEAIPAVLSGITDAYDIRCKQGSNHCNRV